MAIRRTHIKPRGGGRPAPVLTRFTAKYTEASNGCWIWSGAMTSSGYSAFHVNGRVVSAHRWAYTHFVGSIPSGFTIDHLCRTKLCVNPAHLEVVTLMENKRRDIALRFSDRKFCKHGHPWIPENIWTAKNGHTSCRCCANARSNVRYHRIQNEST